MGQYSFLKINQEVNLKGGLVVNEDGELVFVVANGGQISISAPGLVMEIPEVTSAANATGVTLNMPKAYFQMQKADGEDLFSLQSSLPVDTKLVQRVEVQGGALDMSGGSDPDSQGNTSYIGVLENSMQDLAVEAETLSSKENINVTNELKFGTVSVLPPTGTISSYIWQDLQDANGKTIKALSAKVTTKGGCVEADKPKTAPDPISCSEGCGEMQAAWVCRSGKWNRESASGATCQPKSGNECIGNGRHELLGYCENNQQPAGFYKVCKSCKWTYECMFDCTEGATTTSGCSNSCGTSGKRTNTCVNGAWQQGTCQLDGPSYYWKKMLDNFQQAPFRKASEPKPTESECLAKSPHSTTKCTGAAAAGSPCSPAGSACSEVIDVIQKENGNISNPHEMWWYCVYNTYQCTSC